MVYSDEPYRDFEAHEAEQERWLAARPVCDQCGEPIQEDFFFNFDDNKICTWCADSYMRANYLERIRED